RLPERLLLGRPAAGQGQAPVRERRPLPRAPHLAVSPAPLRRYVLLAVALLALVAAAAASGRGALVEVDNLVLRADGAFEPRKLPRSRFPPLAFEGHARTASKDGSRPVALRQLVVDFDHDGRLSVQGLPSCPPERIANATSEEAR